MISYRFSIPLVVMFFFTNSVSAQVKQSDPLEAVKNAAVEILIDGKLNGSGWIATKEGSVITAAHVVWNPHQKVEVMNPTIGRLPAMIVATDPVHDLARLQIQVKGETSNNFPMIKIADRAPFEGDNVFLYGSALFRHWITIKGCMARREPGYEYLSTLDIYCRFSMIAAPSPQGTSGGCWVDSAGKVIGNQSGFINDNGNNPSGLAIVAPLDAIRAILKKNGDGKVATIGCGLEEVFSQSAGFLKRLPEGAMGLFTVPIRKGSTGGEAGLTKETLITHINGTPVIYRPDFMSVFRKVTPGEKVTLRVLTPENHTPREIVVPTRILSRPGAN